MRIRQKCSLTMDGCRKNDQTTTLCLLMIFFHCVHFAIMNGENTIHIVSPSIDASTRIVRDSAGLDEGQIEREGGLLTEREDFKDLSGSEYNNRASKIHNNGILEGNPPLSDKDLIAKDSAISKFTKAYDKFKDQCITSSSLTDEKHREDEQFQQYQIEWGDRIVNKSQRKGGRDLLPRLRKEVANGIPANHRELRAELEKTLNLAERQLKSEGWWTQIVDFFRYLFKRDEWRQYNASLQLSKLRRGLKSGSTLPKMRRPINLLSLFERKGPNFSEAELQLIENMTKGSSHLTAADEALINELGKESFVHHRNMKVQNLQNKYNSAVDKTPQDMKNNILGGLKYFWAMIGMGKDLNKQDRKLFESLEKMKDMEDASQILAQNERQNQSIIVRAWKSRKMEITRTCSSAFAILKSRPNLPVKEKEVLERLSSLWDEGKLSPESKDGDALWKVYKDQREIIERSATEFNQKMQELLRKAQPVDTSHKYLDHIASIEKRVRAQNFLEKSADASKALETKEKMGFSLTQNEKQYSNHKHKITVSNNDNTYNNLMDKLAIENRIHESGQISQDLMKITNGLISNDKKFFHGRQSQLNRLKSHLKQEEKDEIKRILYLSDDGYQLRKETKFVKILKILINVDCRSNFHTEGVKEISKLLDTISHLKDQEIESARLKLDQFKDVFMLWKSRHT
ncbi:hypothetical protein PtA15_11A657 [Puccinia triticina]|uniref:Uncharacterized protein n=1 Tax=Puccinia triticina TaxID=208348 RepID=A0ABY7CYE2_9BASI|nr:uncharacterized protein PtA15_11A657 [Puccinia triticina]WAQ89965.1 hypothetical protein PtA15_11A657 [Puccinia triticina]WAR60003.1 hypothetical protein PtB15_11B644 [Puccinia triticina]